jgi:hypothetical protein
MQNIKAQQGKTEESLLDLDDVDRSRTNKILGLSSRSDIQLVFPGRQLKRKSGCLIQKKKSGCYLPLLVVALTLF